MWKKCKIIMLPTNEKEIGCIMKRSSDNLLSDGGNTRNTILWKNQHLYIISDEEIKEGDWFMIKDSRLETEIFISEGTHTINSPGPYFGKKFIDHSDGGIKLAEYSSRCRKIIASTDSSLRVVSKGINPVLEPIPQIPKSFISLYIEEYNKGNKIEEVEVEYIDNMYLHQPSGKYWENEPVLMKRLLDKDEIYLKLNNNEINIKTIKESWSKEEVLQKMELAFTAGRSYGYYECAIGYGVAFQVKTPESPEPKLFDEWIKENL